MFMERTLSLSVKRGMMAMINMQSWMFLSSYENLRGKLLTHSTILSMAHLGERAFDTIGGAVVSTTAFVIQNAHHATLKGEYTRLIDGNSEAEKSAQLREAIQNPDCGWFYRASAEDFGKIPGSPVAYWMSNQLRNCFTQLPPLRKMSDVKTGMQTGDNPRFLRYWYEVSEEDINPPSENYIPNKRWYLYGKGGEYRLWYGNIEHVVDWQSEGSAIKNLTVNGSLRSRVREISNYFKPAASWSFVSSSAFGCRYKAPGVFFDVAGSCALQKKEDIRNILGFLCSKVSKVLLGSVNPTLNFQIEDIASLPFEAINRREHVNSLITLSRADWDSSETATNFTSAPLLSMISGNTSLRSIYEGVRDNWHRTTEKFQKLEEENNRIFIDAYGLQDELTPEVPIEEITLTCNPAYRYGIKGTEEEREARLKADTMAEFLSYAVGCMFGRYSLDEPGLILANQGETLSAYLARIPEPTFMPDDDNVIPMIDFEGDWFEDDISERFKQFLRVTFGDEHYAENLAFIEDALGKSIQKYFVKDFYNDHVQRYKKRPIYWLFSSPKGTFNALIYMHRYTPSTASVVLNEYLREFRTKLEARRDSNQQISISASSSQKEKTAALKMIQKLDKAIDEVNDYEREVLYPLAGQNIAIDLDDGVKHNYPLFGTALKKITGLS